MINDKELFISLDLSKDLLFPEVQSFVETGKYYIPRVMNSLPSVSCANNFITVIHQLMEHLALWLLELVRAKLSMF